MSYDNLASSIKPWFLDDVVHNTQEWKDSLEEDSTMGWSADSLTSLIIWHCFGCWAKEPGNIHDENPRLFFDYCNSAISRLKRNEDSGILHKDALPAWNALSPSQRVEVEDNVLSSAESFIKYKFPKMKDMNILSVNERVVVDLGIEYCEGFIPFVTQSRGSIVGVVPAWKDDISDCLSLTSTVSGSSFVDIPRIDIWWINDGRISKAKPEEFREVKRELSKKGLV